MVRSMYSGVAGMRAQQSAMDVIGNNISNVKTYGYKASRANFSDVYYQTLGTGSAPTGNRGGTNPTQIGYGAQLSGIDVLHGQSTFSMTGRSMDIAIAGEGFLQVQDGDGNIFYTRAGQLLFDPMGNLVDSNGNFVLGVSGDPLGREPSKEKIQLAIPAVNPSAAKVTEIINSAKVTISSTNNTEDGNVSFNFLPDGSLPGGQDIKAELTGGGTGITLRVNPSANFATMNDFNNAVNKAISDANGGRPHPAGQFSIGIDPVAKFPAGGLTGEQIVSKDYSAILGEFTNFPAAGVFGGMKVVSTSPDFSGSGAGNPTGAVTMRDAARTAATATTPASWAITMEIGGALYTGTITDKMKAGGEFLLKAGTAPAEGFITMTHPGFTSLDALATPAPPAPQTPAATITAPVLNGVTATASKKSPNLGFGSKAIKLLGGTEGGPQGPENLDSIMVGADGIITAKHGVHGELAVGRIDLVTFANPQGLVQAGNTYFTSGPNTGKASYSQPGSKGAGSLATGSLEQSNVDLSQEFSDMITTQRAYQANSRLITVSDTMLEELVNLKR